MIRKIKNWVKDKAGVSPIIAIILMVAITVVLAATIYVWVSGFGGKTGTTSYAITANLLSSDDSANEIVWQISGVEGSIPKTGFSWLLINSSNNQNASGATVTLNDNDGDNYFSAGDTLVVKAPADGVYNFIINYEGQTAFTSGFRHF